MNLLKPIILLMMMAFTSVAWGQDETYLRTPALNSDGTAIAFSFQGDIWSANSSGQNLQRHTIHEGLDIYPKWSPDNSAIAFSSARYGNMDIFTMATQGSAPLRITYNSSNDVLKSWSSAHGLLFETSRTFKQIEREADLGKASPQGGTPMRLIDAVGFEPVASPNGKLIAFVRGSCRVSREAYRGAANREIWIYNIAEASYTKITTFDGNDFNPDWGDDNTIYYISSQSGKYNVHKQAISASGAASGQAQQLTSFEDYGVMSLDVSADGSRVAFEQYNKIFLLNTSDNSSSEVNINISTDFRHDPIEHKTFKGTANEFAVSPNSKYIAFVVRGDVFITENDKEKSRTLQITSSPYREQDVTWLNDSALLFTSDRNGQFNLSMAKSSDPNESNIFKSLKHQIIGLSQSKIDESNPKVSPDGRQLAYQIGRGQLVVANIDENGKLTKSINLLSGWATPDGVSWSPDSKWIAYSLDNLDFNEEVYIHAADNSATPVNMSMHPKGDRSPVWSKDGSKLGFVSTRNNGDADIWFVWLKKSDWDKTKQDWEEEDDDAEEEKKDKDKDKDKKTEVKPIQIDFYRIYDRLEQVTSLPGNESNLAIDDKGEHFFFVNNNNSRFIYKAERDLQKIKWDGSDMTAMTKNNTAPNQVQLGPKGKSLYFLKSGGKLSKVSIDKASVENLPFTAKMDVNHPVERDQMFEEAWRTLNDGFYDPNFHGQDFDQLKNKYKSWAVNASTEDDFRYVFNLMLGQLNASHMGMGGSDEQVDVQKERTGYLGVDINPLKNGVQVNRVIPETPADREMSKLNAGDVITSINGKVVNLDNNFYAPLINTADDRVLLTVTGSDGEDREVVIRPVSSLRTALYEEWVAQRRKLTKEYSNDQLGYIHIRGMNWTSFEQFERELTASGMNKKGVVIDVRFNGGGWTTDYMMTVLSVQQHSYTIPRGAAEDLAKENTKFKPYYPFGERLPLSAWTKPAITLINANSYSNAEIFAHAFKTLDRGTVVGIPTFGAVISTGGRRLIDGSSVRLPFRAWYVLATGQSMENIPAVPDIIIDNQPDSKAKGVDEQLKKAVETLLTETN